MNKMCVRVKLLGLLIFCIACMIPALTGCGNTIAETASVSETTRPVKAIRLASPTNISAFRFPASAKASREVKLAFRVGGPLVTLMADIGDRVEKGEVIARIDPRDFQVRIKTLEAGLAASRSKLVESTLQYERYVNLIRVKAAAKATYDQIQAAYKMAQAQVTADEKTLEAARNALKDTALVAPFNGYIQEKFVENHETVSLGQPILSIVDLSSMEVEIAIPEGRVRQVQHFKTYKCSFESIPDKFFKAEFKEMAKTPNASNQTYPLTLVLEPGALASVRPGMAGEVNISIDDSGSLPSFGVPLQAIVNDDQNKTFVWVVDEKTRKAGRRLVKTAGLVQAGIEVKGDLNAGDWVVTAGAAFLKEGQLTRILKPASPTNVGSTL